MKKIPWFKFDPIDFMDDENVKMMCDEAIGLYIRILCHSWTHDSIPADHDDIRALFKLSKHKFKKLWPKLKKCFFEENERLFNPRLLKEKQEAENSFQQNSKNGKEGALKRWGDHEKASGGANGVANSETMQDSDKDSDKDLDKSSVNSVVNKPKRSTEPKKTKYDKKTCWLISRVVNDHKAAFNLDVTTSSPSVQKLFLDLLSIKGIDSEHQRVLAYIIQSKGAFLSKENKDRLGYAINLLKDPKYAPADSNMADAKRIIAQWNGGSQAQRQVADLAPDLSVRNDS